LLLTCAADAISSGGRHCASFPPLGGILFVRSGRDFLRRQAHPPLPEIDLQEADERLDELVDITKGKTVPLNEAQIEARMRAEAEQVEELLRFLDGFLQA
jgi:hypothetical protein